MTERSGQRAHVWTADHGRKPRVIARDEFIKTDTYPDPQFDFLRVDITKRDSEMAIDERNPFLIIMDDGKKLLCEDKDVEFQIEDIKEEDKIQYARFLVQYAQLMSNVSLHDKDLRNAYGLATEIVGIRPDTSHSDVPEWPDELYTPPGTQELIENDDGSYQVLSYQERIDSGRITNDGMMKINRTKETKQ